tara:strand:- start:560 stop:1342 length:783 start_codon:yes stop_codon:yes gene_type:complete
MKILSIIIVSLNTKKALKRTLKSCFQQDRKDVEIIVVDGLSNDGSVQEILKFKNKISKIIIQKDRGIYDAMNKGINICKSDWIIFMNSGDKFCNTNVVNRFKKFKKKDADIIFGNTIIKNDKFRYLVEGSKFQKNSVLMPFCHQSTITKTKVLKKFLFNIKYNISADFDFFYRCLINNCNFKKYNDVIAEVSSGGLSDQKRQIVFNENIRILKKYNKIRCIGILYCFKFLEILKSLIKIILPNFFINFILFNKYKKKVLE